MKIALSEGVKSVWCNPKDPDTMIAELLDLSSNLNQIGYGGEGGGGGGGGSGSGDYRQTGAEECAP